MPKVALTDRIDESLREAHTTDPEVAKLYAEYLRQVVEEGGTPAQVGQALDISIEYRCHSCECGSKCKRVAHVRKRDGS